MIRYKIAKRKSPRNNAVKFHPTIVPPAAINKEKLIERIEKKCTLASSDIKAVVDALEVELIDALREGNAIRLGDLGSFRPTLRSSGAETEDKVSAQLIKKVHVVFVPSLRVKRSLDVKNGVLQFARAEVVPMAKKKKPTKPSGGSEGGSATPAPSGH